MEISFECGTTRISISTFIILNIYINGLGRQYKKQRTVLKFADDTEVFRKVNTDGDK